MIGSSLYRVQYEKLKGGQNVIQNIDRNIDDKFGDIETIKNDPYQIEMKQSYHNLSIHPGQDKEDSFSSIIDNKPLPNDDQADDKKDSEIKEDEDEMNILNDPSLYLPEEEVEEMYARKATFETDTTTTTMGEKVIRESPVFFSNENGTRLVIDMP